MIALSAVVVRMGSLLYDFHLANSSSQAIYVVTPDNQFTKIGEKSKVAYEDYFRKYQKFLVKNADTVLGKAIYRFFNQKVFPGVVGAVSGSDEVPDELDYDNEMDEIQQDIDLLDLQALSLDDNGKDAESPDTTATPTISPIANSQLAPTANSPLAPAANSPLTPTAQSPSAELIVDTRARHMSPIVEEEPEVVIVEPRADTSKKPTGNRGGKGVTGGRTRGGKQTRSSTRLQVSD